MKSANRFSFLLGFALAGCASTASESAETDTNPYASFALAPPPEEGRDPVGEAESVPAPAPSPAAVSEPAESAVPADPSGSVAKPVPSSGDQLALWNDPEFQRQFTESYIAETEVEPRITVVERDRIQEVLELMSSDRTDKALALLEKHGGKASSAVFDFMIGNIYFQREELDRAALAYGIAVDKYPKFRRAWRNLALIHVRENEFEQAAAAFTRVIELGGGDAITYGLLGFAHSGLEHHLSAETAYRMATLLDPQTMDWKMYLTRSFFEQRRYADAVALCDQLIAEQPERTELWLLQANAYVGLEQPMRAAENYELVDRLGGSTTDSLNMLGDIYVNAELFDLAVTSYVRAMEMDDGGDVARPVRAAKVLTSRGALDETRTLVERIDALHGAGLDDQERIDLLKLRARLAVAAGEGGEEARVLEAIVELDPLDGEALILLGQHAGRDGDVEQAIFYYERAASLEAFEADAKVRHAQLLVGQSRYDEALPLLRRAQMLKPRDNIQEYLEQVERVAQNRRSP
jgi:tetratricopeptide (TPR) repeat protein